MRRAVYGQRKSHVGGCGSSLGPPRARRNTTVGVSGMRNGRKYVTRDYLDCRHDISNTGGHGCKQGFGKLLWNRLARRHSIEFVDKGMPRGLVVSQTTRGDMEHEHSSMQGEDGGSGERTTGKVRNGRAPGQALQPLLRQLREAVLSSLDVSEAEMSGDWSDSTATDSLPIQSNGTSLASWEHSVSSAGVGKASFEVLRIDNAGRSRISHVRRRDLIRQYKLPPRDLRTMDGSITSSTKTSLGINCKDECILINIGGVRAFLTVDKVLLFEPYSQSSKKFVEILCTKLRNDREKGLLGGTVDEERDRLIHGTEHFSSVSDYGSASENSGGYAFPFELEVVEAALNVATLKLEAELVAATHRVGLVLQKLPRYITPANLEELRRVKDVLVALEAKSEAFEELLEGLLEDDEKIAELNLSTRPIREEKRKQRELNKRQREARLDQDGGRDLKFEGSEFYSVNTPLGDISMDQNTIVSQEQAIEEEMQENEDEERELEETEDVLEYYAQRAQMTRSEADRLLQGARDLEESINVSLSLRRYDVNRIELMLSIASFAAAVGACVSGIFGMNLRSTLENSIVGFWGTTAAIVFGCVWIFLVIYRYTKRKRIL